MEKKTQREKNTVGGINTSNTGSLLSISPSISYGIFRVGSNVSDYYNYLKKTYDGDDHYTLDEYDVHLYGYRITLYCRKNGFVDSICFDEHCFFNGRDLIGMSIISFMLMINKEPDSVSIDWIPTKDENHGQHQRCYCFYYYRSKVIQLWTWKKKIVSLLVYDYRD